MAGMRAAVLREIPGKLEIDEIQIDAPGPREVLVRGAILDDGAGLIGGGSSPSSAIAEPGPSSVDATPDPYALRELSRDIRPPDYATSFARLATTLSGLDVALAVVGSLRPAWLEAVTGEPGVQVMTRAQALALFV